MCVLSAQLRLIGIGASPSAVRYVWQRHGLTLRMQRDFGMKFSDRAFEAKRRSIN